MHGPAKFNGAKPAICVTEISRVAGQFLLLFGNVRVRGFGRTSARAGMAGARSSAHIALRQLRAGKTGPPASTHV